MAEPPNRTLDRDRLRKLLAMLDSSHDGEALNAGRLAAALLREAGLSWADIIPDAPARADGDTDLARLDALIASANVSDVLKIRLRAMRVALRGHRLAESDRRLIWILHRKAVLDGSVVHS
jgi:hypothetical protein